MTPEKKEEKKVDFSLEAVTEKPTRKYRKGSKYHPILNQFLETTHDKPEQIHKVQVEGKDANYMRTQLKKIIDKDNLDVLVSVVNNEVYLERPKKVEVKKIK